MGRLRAVTESELTPGQRAVWDSVTGGARAAAHKGSGGLVGPDGELVGPFNAWLYSPTVGLPAASLGEAVRFRCSFGARLSEVAIVAVAAHWRSNFEYWAHRRYAAEAGVPEDLLDDLAEGRQVNPERDDERVVVGTCRELLTTARLSDETYRAALDLLGAAGIVELVTLVGYYTLVALNLNAFEVGLPPGAEPQWPVQGSNGLRFDRHPEEKETPDGPPAR